MTTNLAYWWFTPYRQENHFFTKMFRRLITFRFDILTERSSVALVPLEHQSVLLNVADCLAFLKVSFASSKNKATLRFLRSLLDIDSRAWRHQIQIDCNLNVKIWMSLEIWWALVVMLQFWPQWTWKNPKLTETHIVINIVGSARKKLQISRSLSISEIGAAWKTHARYFRVNLNWKIFLTSCSTIYFLNTLGDLFRPQEKWHALNIRRRTGASVLSLLPIKQCY